jgi:C1A family cysteine protease
MAAFEDFVAKHGKTYESEEEKAVRYNVFKENRVFIQHSNQDGKVTYALNRFADLTHAEFKNIYVGGYRPDLSTTWGVKIGTHVYSGAELPAEVDWTTKDAVTPVKNQGQCGSCWAFSTTGSLEGAYAIATGTLVSVSEQQLVDCAQSFGEQGCSGGLMDNAFRYAELNDMCTEESYPYTAADGQCNTKGCTIAIDKQYVTGFKDVDHTMEAMMEAVAKGPVSIAIEADQGAFQFYSGGVLSQECGTQLDHGVLCVGYGELNGKKYWKVKNSWGASWGSDGYILLERGNSPDGAMGECGLLTQPSYPIIKASEEMLI